MDPIVETTAGSVRGTVDGTGTAVFLGVPFAAPPFGERRFAAPVPPERWDGVRTATDYGHTAPQPHRQFTLVPEPVIDGPDCLNLNVFTPNVGGAGLPVLFWIHGGGFTAGSSASPWYRGQRFCRDGVVVVSVNYRLGAEGFLSIDGAPHNRGVRDWVAALEWVQDNIARFGGDPGQVTIAGQSAGGAACATLLATPAAGTLFHRAICMSGSALPSVTPAQAADLTVAMADELGVAPTLEALASVEPSRFVDAQDAAVARLPKGAPVRLAYAPLAGDDVVPADVAAATRVAAAGGLPLLLGATDAEFNAAVGGTASSWDDDRLERRLQRLGLDAEGVLAYRRRLAEGGAAALWGQAVTDSTFKTPALRLADRWAGAGGDAFLYSFDWRSRANPAYGAVHCLDIPFVFDNLDAGGVVEVTGADPPQALADAMHEAWVSFVRDGDPGWARYDADARVGRRFDEHGGSDVEHLWAFERDAWLRH
jgi:para-nitrobenzyl esterase